MKDVTIEKLRELRIKLGIPQKEVTKYVPVSTCFLSQLETGKISSENCQHILKEYQQFLKDVVDGKITPKTSAHVEWEYRKYASPKEVLQLTAVRQNLGLSLEDAANLSRRPVEFIKNVEDLSTSTFRNDCKSLMRHYRQVKLVRIFGWKDDEAGWEWEFRKEKQI